MDVCIPNKCLNCFGSCIATRSLIAQVKELNGAVYYGELDDEPGNLLYAIDLLVQMLENDPCKRITCRDGE